MMLFLLLACGGGVGLPAPPSPLEVAPQMEGSPQAPLDASVRPRAQKKHPAGCSRIITPNDANRLFGLLARIKGDDSCTFEGLHTRSSTMIVQWKLEDGEVISWQLEPLACTNGAKLHGIELALSDPDQVKDRCPQKWYALSKAVRADTLIAPHAASGP